MSNKNNSLKLFISYSHEDEAFKDELEKHLRQLQRKGVLSELWSDRDLVAGDRLNSEIKRQLLSADLLLFLVSIDFLDSFYCVQVELKETLKRLDHDDLRVIPVILRACDWASSELGDYVAANKDGVAINKSADRDEAWTKIANAIERATEKLAHFPRRKSVGAAVSVEEGVKKFSITPDFDAWRRSLGISLQHKRVTKLELADVFVYPDLKNLKEEFDKIGLVVSADKLILEPQSYRNLIVFGGEQAGKTSLARSFFNLCSSEDSTLPLYVEAKDISSTTVKEFIKKAVKRTYKNCSSDLYLENEAEKVLIIDDFQSLPINRRYQEKLIESMDTVFDRIIIFSDSSIKYDEKRVAALSGFNQFELLPFGNVLRGELIDKWNSLGQAETVPVAELHAENDRIERHVNSVILRNVLPANPFYVLATIQMLEASSPSDYSLTSYGHCYQTLIQAAFSKASIRAQEFDSFINYLSELAYFIYQGGSESISALDIVYFQDKYSREYLIESHDYALNKIEQSGLLVRDGSRLYFSYKYIFYFYVARYLSDHLNTNSCKEEIKSLCRLIHLEKSANILIFLIHHTKDEDIIGELIANSEKIFEDSESAALDVKDTAHIARYISDIPGLILEERDIEAERKKRLRSKDIAEERDSGESRDDAVEGDDGFLADVNRSFRSIQIIGQILGNRKGSLNKRQLQALAVAAEGAGLRFLKFFLALTERSEHTILKLITEALKQRDDLSDDDIADEARKMFLFLCYGTSYAVVKHLADSLGSRELLSIFESIKNERSDQPVYSIIFVAMRLEFTKEIPRDDVELLYRELEGNPIAERLLQEIVVRHLHLNHVSYKDQQWISDKLAIPLATQKILQRKDRNKIE